MSDKAPRNKKIRYVRLSEGRAMYFYPEAKENTVWEVARESKTIHPTQKPIELPIRAITNSSKEGEIVVDFFGGSGSTLMAAETCNRTCYSTELDPKYIDAIVKRYIETCGASNVTCERDGEIYTADEIFGK